MSAYGSIATGLLHVDEFLYLDFPIDVDGHGFLYYLVNEHGDLLLHLLLEVHGLLDHPLYILRLLYYLLDEDWLLHHFLHYLLHHPLLLHYHLYPLLLDAWHKERCRRAAVPQFIALLSQLLNLLLQFFNIRYLLLLTILNVSSSIPIVFPVGLLKVC